MPEETTLGPWPTLTRPGKEWVGDLGGLRGCPEPPVNHVSNSHVRVNPMIRYWRTPESHE